MGVFFMFGYGYAIGMPNSIMSRYYEKSSADSEPKYDIKTFGIGD
jgi:hypothetical protein